MLRNTGYYLKKLSKKPPPGCAKLEHFEFGRRVTQYEPSPAQISRPVQDDEKITDDKQTLTLCSGEQDTCTGESPKGTRVTQNKFFLSIQFSQFGRFTRLFDQNQGPSGPRFKKIGKSLVFTFMQMKE